jgi:hypothetical protein
MALSISHVPPILISSWAILIDQGNDVRPADGDRLAGVSRPFLDH